MNLFFYIFCYKLIIVLVFYSTSTGGETMREGDLCTMMTIIDDPDLVEGLWGIFNDLFKNQEVEHGQDHRIFTWESFQEVMVDPDWQKHVVRSEDGCLAGLAIVTNNLEKARICYINPEAFEAAAPDYKGKIYYIAFMYIKAEYQGTQCFWDFNESIFEHSVAQGGIPAFDVDARYMAGFEKAPQFFLKDRYGITTEPKCLTRQEYWILVPKK